MHITYSLAKVAALLARKMSYQEVAEYLGLQWRHVAKAVKWAVEWGFAHKKTRPLHVLGLDEVSRRKGHRYLTVAYDLERHEVVWVGKDREEKTVDEFFSWLGKRRARAIQVVCMDMWAPYLASVRRHVPKATVVFDRFHIVQHLSRAVDDVRRQVVATLAPEERFAVKKSRWILIKNPWNLKPDERQRLGEILKLNLPITKAYLLKEAFQKFWEYLQPGRAEPYLRQWLWWASHSRLKPFKEFARMIRDHLDGVLAWTNIRVSNGALEGMNNKIKMVSHRSFGFRKFDTYVTAIYHSCSNLPLPS